VDHVGRGTFGSVYKAKLKSTGAIYALKQQDKEKLIDQNHIKYVMGELNILKQLNHPFLIHLHFAF
jgi:serum/glucocorticoid-regulated kinase 2